MQSLHRRAASAQVLANAVHVELEGDEQASAYGYTVKSPSPLLVLARDLLEDEPGWFAPLPMLAYRGDTLCLIARSVAEAAALEVNGQGTGFIRVPKRRRRSLVRQNEPALPIPTPTAPDASGKSTLTGG